MNPYIFNTIMSGVGISFFVIVLISITAGISADAIGYFYERKTRPDNCKGFWRVLLFNYKCLSQMRHGKPDPWGRYRDPMDWEDFLGTYSCGIWFTLIPIGVLTGATFLLRYFTTFESGRMILLGIAIFAGGLVSAYWIMKGFWIVMGKMSQGIDKVDSVVAAVEKTVDGGSHQLSEDHATTEVRVTI
jgi:hypothetical protein